MSNIKDHSSDSRNKAITPLKKLERQFLWVFLVVWIIIPGTLLFSYLYTLINPVDISNVRSHEGVASIQYIGGAGRSKSKTLVIGDKYFSCRIDLSDVTKSCGGIPQDFLQSKIMVDYISMRWDPTSVTEHYPVRITNLNSGQSVSLIEDKFKFAEEHALANLKSSIIISIIQLLILLSIIKFLRYIERKNHGSTR